MLADEEVRRGLLERFQRRVERAGCVVEKVKGLMQWAVRKRLTAGAIIRIF
jgi:hypothetical protein